MAGSETRPSIAALQETLGTIRSELNDLKNRPSQEKDVQEIVAQLKGIQEELASAKGTPPPTPTQTKDHGKQTSTKRRSFLPTF